MRTVANAAMVDQFHGHFQDAVNKGLTAVALAQQVDDPRTEALARMAAVFGLGNLGNHQEMALHASALLELAERLRDRSQLGTALWVYGAVPNARGDWQAVRDIVDRGLAVVPADPRLLSRRVILEYEVGEFADGEAYLGRLLESIRKAQRGPSHHYVSSAITIPIVARITRIEDLLDVARDAANTVLSSPYTAPIFAQWARAGLGLLAVLGQDIAGAREQYAALEPLRGTRLGPYIAADRLLGLLAHTMSVPDAAEIHFEDALDFCHRGGDRPEYAWCAYEYAELLIVGAGLNHAPTGGDSVKAMSLLEEALTISSELGMRPLMVRVASLQESARSLPAKTPGYPNG